MKFLRSETAKRFRVRISHDASVMHGPCMQSRLSDRRWERSFGSECSGFDMHASHDSID